MTDYPPRPSRVITSEPCTIARGDGSLLAGTLVNLSNLGFCVDAQNALLEGEHIEMRVLGLGRMRGTIHWARKRRAGGLLDI